MLKETEQCQKAVLSDTDINQILDLAQKSHENYLVRSNRYDLDKALIYYSEVIRINPSISHVYYKIASLLWEKGDIDINSAIKKCKKAVELDSKSSQARLYLGYFLKTAGRFKEAETSFKEAIKLSGFMSSKPRIALGLTIIRRLQETSPSLPEFIKAIYYFFTGITMTVYDYDVIKMFYRSAMEDFNLHKYQCEGEFYKKLGCYEKAIGTYEKAAVLTGRKDLFYSKVGDALVEIKQPEEAIDFYRHALIASQNDIVLWAKLADLLQKHDRTNYESITQCYNHMARLEPANANIFYELGHLYLRKEDRFSAVNAFKRAIEIDPANAFYHNSLAYALVQLQDYEGAITEYQKAIRINPDNEWTSIVSQALGAIYHQVKDNMEAAILAYQTAIVLDPNNVDAYMSLGEAYQDRNDLDNAVECYCKAVQLDPNIPRVYCNLGLVLWEKGCIDEALIAYHKAVALNPKYEIAYNNLGVIYLDGLNKPEEAIIRFTLAIKNNPNYALAYYNKGRCYQEMRDKSGAAKYYQMAIDINRLTNEIDEDEVQERLYSLFAVA